MIIIGYQGIGKSTLAKETRAVLDLESSCMWVNGKRDENWQEVYCNFAEDFSRQGYIVFTSSHEVVRNRLKNSAEKVLVCCPDPRIRDSWVSRLTARYERTGLEKDYKALKNAEDRYEDNIRELMESGFPVLLIKDSDGSVKDALLEAGYAIN